ncbi:phage portal protein [Hymenobacter sp. M29]|uniref:Phage portal protein n=1 Tax=Hymenobacter mellowenesis TaxID=3063995 RepID=A0ABT9AFK8_9BACT|nr:phage portal protein [Hymenobacter sp. M29]MDO7847462.1 phage portal protein [Hymenobacter sp. M29]
MPNFFGSLFATKDTPAALETKAIVGTDYLGRTNPVEMLGGTPIAYQGLNKDSVLKDGYTANAVAYSIISYILNTGETTKWNVYGLTSADQTAQPLPQHPLASVLYRPNPKQSWSDFKKEVLGQYLLTGNAFIWKNATTRGKVQELWVLPCYTEVVGGGPMREVTVYRVPKGDGTYDPYPAKDVLHLKAWNPEDSRYGLSPISAGYKLVTSANSGLDLRIKQYQNQGVPGILYHDAGTGDGTMPPLTPEQVNGLVGKIRNWFAPKSAYTIPFTGAKLGYVKLGLSAVDLDVLKALDADRNAIADLYHFPAHLLNGGDSATFNNVSEARKALWSSCILPLESMLRDGLNHWLGLLYGDAAYIEFDVSHIDELQEDKKQKAEWLALCPYLTINEKREAMGFGVIDGGEGYLMPKGTVYSKSLTEPAAASEAMATTAESIEETGKIAA